MVQIIRLFQSDQQLIDSIRSNNDSALAHLYEKNIRMIMKFVTQNNGTEKDAVNILQDALVILWEKVRRDDFTLKAKLSTFLYSVVKNIWLRELAHRKKFASLEDLNGKAASNSAVDEQIEKDELTEIVKNCLARLSDICRKILIAFYYDEISMKAISSQLGLASEDVAKSKKYQCKKELERLVKESLK